MTSAASSDEPVKIYYDSLEKLHTNIRRNTPFTFLSYKSMIPAKDDDFVGLTCKISYYITFRFFVQVGSQMSSPLWAALPYLPFIFDFLWIGYRWIRGIDDKQAPPLTAIFYLALGLASIRVIDQIHDC